FGAKVKSGCGDVFTVCDIRRDAECDYIYNGDRCSGPHYAEFDLELFQEPQKKKLYAIQNMGTGLIEFTLNECPVNYRHVSEYDIEYNAIALCKEQENT